MLADLLLPVLFWAEAVNTACYVQNRVQVGRKPNLFNNMCFYPYGLLVPKIPTNAATFEVKEPESEVYVSPSSSDKTKKHDEKTKREAKGKSHVELSTGVRDLSDEFE
nr:hypothetical protein [Tanacetum cinerariifolium]